MGVDLDRSLSDDESSDDGIDAAAHRCAGALPRGFATVAEGEDDGGDSSDEPDRVDAYHVDARRAGRAAVRDALRRALPEDGELDW